MENNNTRSSSEDTTGRNIRLGMAVGTTFVLLGYFWPITLILFIVCIVLSVFVPIKIPPCIWGLGIFVILSAIMYRAMNRAR